MGQEKPQEMDSKAACGMKRQNAGIPVTPDLLDSHWQCRFLLQRLSLAVSAPVYCIERMCNQNREKRENGKAKAGKGLAPAERQGSDSLAKSPHKQLQSQKNKRSATKIL
jgi:hypothetical protein